MKILVTGARGFIGRNLVERLRNIRAGEIYGYDKDDTVERLDRYCGDCDLVFHLAGINRPEREEGFKEGNPGFTSELLGMLEGHHNLCPVVMSSSVQAGWDNPYGKSKLAAEELLREHGARTGAKILIYRFPNVFGKWCRPYYNSAVATFCYNVARGLPLQVNGRDTRMDLVYIDDVVDELVRAMNGQEDRDGAKRDPAFYQVRPVYGTTLGEIVDMLGSFRSSREDLQVPDMTEGSLSKKLYSTYLSYLPEDSFSYLLSMHTDQRGSFTEILRTVDRGQISVNVVGPGVEKGDHWHDTKSEKFLVVSGKALIRFRKPGSDDIYSYHVSGEKLEMVDIPCGYAHSISNEGNTDLVTLMWSSECYDPRRPDTYPLSVSPD